MLKSNLLKVFEASIFEISTPKNANYYADKEILTFFNGVIATFFKISHPFFVAHQDYDFRNPRTEFGLGTDF